MSSVQFESSRRTERDREALRVARERVLDKARVRAEREADRRDQEEAWMLPSLEKSLDQDGSAKKKKKKHKKDKKSKKKKAKKEKKRKSKRSRSRSSSESSSSEEEWVEKGKEEEEDGDKEAAAKAPEKRQDWMELGGDLFGVRTTDRSALAPMETEKQRMRREAEEKNREKANRLELNPQLKQGTPAAAEQNKPESRLPSSVGDGGASWLRKAYKRAQERAAAEGRSLEEVAAERWGSLENFHRLLAKAEGRGAGEGRRDGGSGGGGGRHERLREFKRDRERQGRKSRSRSRSRSGDRRRRRRSRSRSEDGSGSSSRRRRRSRSRSRSRSPPRKRGSFARPGGDDGEELEGRWNRGGGGFDRPGSDDDRRDERRQQSGGLASKFAPSTSSSLGSWKSSERRDREQQEAKKAREEREREKSPPSPARSSSPQQEESAKQQQQQDKPPLEEEKVLSEKELNAIGAKLVKAELMGNEALIKKLKAKLERAREAKETRQAQGGGGEEEEEQVVVLTRTDAKGMTRPVEAQVESSAQGGRRRTKKAKVQTHSKEGERERYFADDDRHSLREMFEREKMGTAEDSNSMFARLAGKGMETTDDTYDMDDVMESRAARKGAAPTAQEEAERERKRAIEEHRKGAQALEGCRQCLGGPAFQRHLLVALGRTCTLSLPAHASLTEGHCVVSPSAHVAASTLLDEDVWREMQEFRSALVRMFAERDEDCVFFETCTRVRGGARAPHLRLECVPLPREAGDSAPMFFQKAIQECEGMWAQNKKLIKLSRDRDIRRAVPRELPYFHVDFGDQDGFAHVLEDEADFPRNFAQEILGGMLDLEPRLWRNPKRDSFEAQKAKVLAFGADWKKVDFTKRGDGGSSSSSSDSESD